MHTQAGQANIMQRLDLSGIHTTPDATMKYIRHRKQVRVLDLSDTDLSLETIRQLVEFAL